MGNQSSGGEVGGDVGSPRRRSQAGAHPGMRWMLLAYALWPASVFVMALLGGLSLTRSGFEALCILVAFLSHIVPNMFLHKLNALLKTTGAKEWSDARAWGFVAGVHALVALSAVAALCQITDLKMRWFGSYLVLMNQIKLQDSLNCLALAAPSQYAGGSVASRGRAEARARAIMKMSPLLRAAVQTFPPDTVNECLVPVDTPEKRARLWRQFGWDMLRMPAALAGIYLLTGYLMYNKGINVNDYPFVMGFIHMYNIYPALTLVTWPPKLVVYFLTGGVPAKGPGNWPIKSATMREFWGRRYNEIIGDLCRKAMFDPLIRAGWSTAAASFVVFFVTGSMHALPTAFIGSLPIETAGQLVFFIIHWAICVAEAHFAPESKSVVRTVSLFFLVYPIFGISGVHSMCRDRVGFFVVMPEFLWRSVFG